MGSALSCCLRPADGDLGAATFPPQPLGAPSGFQGTHFVAIKLLGRGAYADTWLFRDVRRSRLVAIKLFKRASLTRDMLPVLLREAGIQAELGPTSIHLVEVYEAVLTPNHVGFIMEYAAGGALTGYIAEAFTRAVPGGLVLPLNTARFLFIQFCRAVSQCHALGVAHRDLKLDNTLLDGSSPPVVKIADFGFARRVAPMDRATSHLGTPEYMSPELLHGATEEGAGAGAGAGGAARRRGSDKAKAAAAASSDPVATSLGAVASGGAAWPPRQAGYDPRASDAWAAGVFLTVCLCGAFPFDHAGEADPRTAGLKDHELDLYTQEVTRNWKESPFLRGNIGALPPDAADLLNHIFEVDPRKRATLPEILAHPFVTAPLDEPRYSDALAALEAAQARLDEHIRHRSVDPSKVRARIGALRALLEEGVGGGGGGPVKTHMRPLHQFSGDAFLARVDLTEASVLVDGSNTCECEGVAERDRMASGLPPTGSSARVDEVAAAEAAHSASATPRVVRGGRGGGKQATTAAAATPFAAAAAQRFSSSVSSAGGGGAGAGAGGAA